MVNYNIYIYYKINGRKQEGWAHWPKKAGGRSREREREPGRHKKFSVSITPLQAVQRRSFAAGCDFVPCTLFARGQAEW